MELLQLLHQLEEELNEKGFLKESEKGGQAIITSLENALSALEGKTGTTIIVLHAHRFRVSLWVF